MKLGFFCEEEICLDKKDAYMGLDTRRVKMQDELRGEGKASVPDGDVWDSRELCSTMEIVIPI